jgi:pentose-5-phosphate-3-epimerase
LVLFYFKINAFIGVGPSNLDICLKHGANMIVSGTAITNSKNRREAIDSMKKIMESHF